MQESDREWLDTHAAPCSRNARPQKGLVRRAQLEQIWVPCQGRLSPLGREEEK